MKMRLYQLIISESKGLLKGAFLGEISLIDGKTQFQIADPTLKMKLEGLFSKPLATNYGDPSGTRTVTLQKQISPHTPEFFREVYFELRNVHRIFPEIKE